MSARLRRAISLTLAAACLHGLAPGAARAQAAPPAATDAATREARERFDRGLKIFNDGDNAGALAEFERAYALIPNAIVLYNIGLVYAAMGRPVESVEALDRVLASPGPVAGDRLTRARQTRDEQAQRIAELSVVTSVPAAIDVDGVAAGQTPLAAPLKVAGGVHLVGAVAAGYAPIRKSITVAGAQKAEVQLDLVAMQGLAAHLTLRTHLPGADVVVDDQIVGRTPLPQSLTVAPGPHKIELRRAGYATARQDMTLGDGASGEITLEPEADPAAPATEVGTLALDISESQAVVTVDGKPRGPYAGEMRLPTGAHRLLVERGGFEPVERDVTLDAGRTTTVRIGLDPTPDTRAAYVSRTTSQRTWGIVATAGGLLVAGGGVGFAVWNAGQQSTAQSDLSTAQNNVNHPVKGSACDTSGGGDPAKCNAPLLDAQSRLNDANTRAVFGYVGIGVGVAATALGVYLLVSNDSPHRYDKPESQILARRTLLPLAWGDARGGGVGLAGSF
jgi:hypothetical protein